MLATQVQYWGLKETERSNKEQERLKQEAQAEAKRHNLTSEKQGWSSIQETHRHNYATETLERAKQRETGRHNLEQEKQGWSSINEQARHNVEQERISWGNLSLGKNQLAESIRHNQAVEMENQRHNAAFERETQRHNQAQEGIGWGNVNLGWGQIQLGKEQLGEHVRHNLTQEMINTAGVMQEGLRLMEQNRHNKATESVARSEERREWTLLPSKIAQNYGGAAQSEANARRSDELLGYDKYGHIISNVRDTIGVAGDAAKTVGDVAKSVGFVKNLIA